jgi:hypothetical protein
MFLWGYVMVFQYEDLLFLKISLIFDYEELIILSPNP